ncbi:SEL1-like repeat protein [Acinetobacter sp. P8-3-8]|uniref:SEL1-like repeat protein n=1 Tax=Acinetobacter sp. P8-3-8 TaxID=1029823 RepID=UPI00024875F6|nr:SEL1-like repeat protein [Acinetobacter sp. P8-3-8]
MLVHILNRFLGDSTSRYAFEKNVSEASLEKSQAHDFESKNSFQEVPSDSADNRNAMWCYLRAALRGDQEAQYKMGLSYLNGQLGLDRSYSHAEKWLEQAAHQGHTHAKEELTKAYDELAFS